MTTYAKLNESNMVLGLFQDNLNPNIPEDAVEMPQEVFQDFMDGKLQVFNPDTNTWSEYIASLDEQLTEARTAALQTCKTGFRNNVQEGVEVAPTTVLDGTSESIINLESAYLFENNLGNTTITVRDFYNNTMVVELPDLLLYINALKTHYKTLINKKWSNEDYINDTARTLEELTLYNW